MKVYEAVASSLRALGVGQIFGVMGDANMRFLATYVETGDGTYVGTAHEAGAVAMADGLSRMTGSVGVVSLTHGPGVTNGLTALTEAVRAGSALVVLTGSTPPGRRRHNQWLDLRAAADLAGAAFHQVRTPGTVAADISLAMRSCLITRRPVVLDIPAGLLDEASGTINASNALGPPPILRPLPDDHQFDAAIGVIASANRPLILAGRGAVFSGARADVCALAKELDAPLATSVMALHFGAGYPLHLGIFGVESHSVAARYISQADCIIVLGAGLNDFTTANGDLLRNKAVVRCDADPVAFSSADPKWISVLSDVRTFARKATDALAEIGQSQERAWTLALRRELDTFDPASDFVDASQPPYVDLRAAMVTLDEVLPQPRTLVTDVGRFKVAAWRHLRCAEGCFTYPGSYSAIGLGLPMAIGAAFAQPDTTTVCVAGDGGLMMSINELAVAVEHSLPIVLAVANNSAYGVEYFKLLNEGHDPKHSLRVWPSFAALATGFGASGYVIADCDAIKQLKPQFDNLSSPVVLDIRMDVKVDVRKYR